ncbi:hypothetical protein B566_EDAN003504 [Ephemera danica]|nr:hypothetical protein B566_EDAN003504 [Ephemera danica]
MGRFYSRNVQLESNSNSTKNNNLHNSCILVDCKVATSDSKWTVDSEASGSTDELVYKAFPALLPQVLAAVVASCISLATGASLAFVTATLSLLKHESSRVQTSDNQLSWLASYTMLGALVGGLLSGPCMSQGRRTTLWACAVPLILAWVILAKAHNVFMFHTSHFIFGLCIGIGNDAAQLYISEMAYSSSRGALGCIPVAMFNFGTMAFYFAALFKLPWDTLAWVGVGLTLPALVLPVFLPESPTYLASKCKRDSALLALNKLRGSAWDAGPELTQLLSLERPRLGLRARLSALQEKSFIQPLLVVTCIRLFSRFCGMRAIQTYTQHILLESNSSLSVELATFLTGLVQFISILVACIIVENKSRHFYMLTSLGVMTLSLLLLATYLTLNTSAMLEEHQHWLGSLPMVCIAVYLIGNSLGLGPISGLILGELVPQRHRCLASSITGSLSWLAAFIVTKTYIDFNAILNLQGTLFMYAAICILGIVFVTAFVPETRGKSQLEIEDLFGAEKLNDSKEQDKQKSTKDCFCV